MNYKLNIGWLYPDLMSTYGDRGNILVLQKRCEWRDIAVTIIPIDQEVTDQQLTTIDLLFGGGSQDKEQEIVMKDLRGMKQNTLKELVENDIPALFVCGAPQLMGKYYEPAVGQRIEGVGIFDMITENPGPKSPRCIGNTVAEVYWENFGAIHPGGEIAAPPPGWKNIVGFENHGGRTYLGSNAKPFAKIIKGFGNNGKDKTEGVVYKNAIGCYLHGPLLPKNPHIADFLIQRALEVKYKKEIQLPSFDDTLELLAHKTIVEKLKIKHL